MSLVEKLREEARYWSIGGKESRGVAANYRDAADEIERLRTETRALRQDNGAVIAQLQNEIEGLLNRAANAKHVAEQLRAALERYDRHDKTISCDQYDCWCKVALEQKDNLSSTP